MILSQHLLTISQRSIGQAAFSYLGREISYSELVRTAGRLSYLFQKEIGIGARVAFLCSPSPSLITGLIGLSNIRSLMIPLDPAAPNEMISAWLRDTEPEFLAVSADQFARARDLLKNERRPIKLFEIEKKKAGEYDPAFKPKPDQGPKDTDEVLLLRTAGRTGPPKYVAFNHKQIIHAATCLKQPYKLMPTDRVLTMLPWSHTFALLHGVLLPILNGCTCVIWPGMELKDLIEFLAKTRVSRLVGTPTTILEMLSAVEALEEKPSLSWIKSCTVSIDELPPEILARREPPFPISVCMGMTEVFWTLSMSDPEVWPPGAGKPITGSTYKVVDRLGDEVTGKRARQGQLAVMTQAAMCGYRATERKKKDAEKATKSILRGNWVYTGEQATLQGEPEALEIRINPPAGRSQPEPPAKPAVPQKTATVPPRPVVAAPPAPQPLPEPTELEPELSAGVLELAQQLELSAEQDLQNGGSQAPEDWTPLEPAELRADQPLPVPLYVFVQGRYVKYREPGTTLDRKVRDHLILSKGRQIFVRTADKDAYFAWYEASKAG